MLQRFRSVLITILCCLALIACGGEELPADSAPIANKPCQAPEGIHITDVNSLTDWINALPKPTSLPCFVESLPRPMRMTASLSDLSAQLSVGRRSPRVFIFIDNMILTIATSRGYIHDLSDEGKTDLLELALISTPLETLNVDDPIFTIKGEYKFPVEDELPYSAPYDRIDLSHVASVCAVCHEGERYVDSVDGVPIYESVMLQPYRSGIVSIDALEKENSTCKPELETHRCKMLKALMEQGELIPETFPENAGFF